MDKKSRYAPLSVVAHTADQVIEMGGTVYQTFTCSACGQGASCEQPNVLYTQGQCPTCGATMDLTSACGIIAIFECKPAQPNYGPDSIPPVTDTTH